MHPLKLYVSAEEKGDRLDQFVARLTAMTRTQAQRLIVTGAVKVDGAIQPKNHRVQPGECVELELPEPTAAEPVPQDIPIEILYQDRDLAVVSKPAGLVVHPAAGHADGTLVNALLYTLDDLSGIGGVLRPGIVHRLDRDTSGLMVVAKNDASHLRLQEMVGKRQLKRLYLALVHGIPATRLGTIDAPVGRDTRNRKRMSVTGDAGRKAVTHFKVEREFENCALLEVELVTGRTHQIRVHLSYIGHPVVGDREYGMSGSLERESGLERQFLHAYRLSFPHPTSGEEMSFMDPLPADLEQALRGLEAT
ncbi:MAG: RluA family pseudouridine synthase [Actinobacteria bacterium]|nr:RluA family pseudouridine synthase [Actinomycetota bacterium]